MFVAFADAGVPPGIAAGGLACIVLGVLLSAAAVIGGLAWLGTRKRTAPAANLAAAALPARLAFAAALVLGGVACLATAMVCGTSLDAAYVNWSSARATAEAGRPPGNSTPERPPYRSPLAGAPLSVLSPTLIWLSVGLGLVLVVTGLWTGLRAPPTSRGPTEEVERDGAAKSPT